MAITLIIKMRQPDSFSTKCSIPIYSIISPRSNDFIYAGGGGQSKSGIANAINSINVDVRKKTISPLAEIKLSIEEDAPMCMTLTPDENDDELEEEEEEEDPNEKPAGISESQLQHSEELHTENEKSPQSSSLNNGRQSHKKIIAAINSAISPSGENKNLRTFEWTSLPRKEAKDGDLKQVQTIKPIDQFESVSIKDADVYVRCMSTSPNGSLVAVGSTDGQFSMHSLPTLKRLWSKTVEDKNGIVDLSFSADSALIAIVTSDSVQVFPTVHATNHDVEPELYQTIRNPSLKGSNGCVFRAACFGRNAKGNSKIKSSRLYTVLNSNPASGLGSSKKDREKAKIRKCFITSWETDSWTIVQSRQIGDRPATVAEISDDGSFIAISTSDLSLHLLSSHSLKTIWQIRDTHAFPGTCLAFSRNGKLLASGSADMTLRIASIGNGEGMTTSTAFIEGKFVMFTIALVLAILAWYFQKTFLT